MPSAPWTGLIHLRRVQGRNHKPTQRGTLHSFPFPPTAFSVLWQPGQPQPLPGPVQHPSGHEA